MALAQTVTDVVLDRICVKFYARDPAALDPAEIIPVFHRWIQHGAVGGLPIDVADYSHVPDGPGVILIGHEVDYYIDGSGGSPGLLYSRKRLASGTHAERLRGAIETAARACRLLEAEPALRDKGLEFDGGRFRVIVNDRLGAPNSDETLAALGPDLERVLATLYPDRPFTVRRDASDPRDRFAIEVLTTGARVDVATLLERIATGPN